MNQINPLHIGALLFVVLLFSFFKLNAAKAELVSVEKSYKESEKLALELSGLKASYADGAKTKTVLKRILSQSSLKNASITSKTTKHSMLISAASLDKRALNFLMGKILNGNYNIVKLKIKKLSAYKASLAMEIQW